MRRGATRGRSPRQRFALGEMACPQAVASTFRPGVEHLSIRYRDGRKRCHTRKSKVWAGSWPPARASCFRAGWGCVVPCRILLVKPGFSTSFCAHRTSAVRDASVWGLGVRETIWNRCARAGVERPWDGDAPLEAVVRLQFIAPSSSLDHVRLTRPGTSARPSAHSSGRFHP